MNRRSLFVLGIAAAILVGGCVLQTIMKKNTAEEKCEKQFFAMDTFMTFTAYGGSAEKAVDAAISEVKRLDALLSAESETSEISILNRNGGGSISEDTKTLLLRAQEVYKETEGLFDFTIYPLMQLWGFPSQNYHVAAEEEIQELLPLVNAGGVQLTENQVTLEPGQNIDLGAIAKGYTSARLIEIYRENGVDSGMVYLGGNVQTLGTKPDGSKWRIGIQEPSGEQGNVALSLEISDQAVITSGGYERYFEENGKTYIHILDPRDGRPVENDLASVTIVSADGTLADALSTSLFIMGKDKAVEFWKSHAEEFQMILITKDDRYYVTEALEKTMHCSHVYEIVRV